MGIRFSAVCRACIGTMFLALAVAPAAMADPPDPMRPLLNRMEAYFHREEIDGITRDSRYALNPTEVIRLSIVSQLLAFNELAALQPHGPHDGDVRARADFLIDHMAEIRSRTPFDGMLGYAMLGAYELTGDTRYFDAGERIVWDVMPAGGFANTLNWGLMSAMATAKYYELTGNVAARNKTQQIVNSLAIYQHADGSFPHYCPGSVDVHYTGWMGMELIHVRRSVPSPQLDATLERIAGFLATRIAPDGRTSYETPCPTGPYCTKYYYSQRSGCSFDYDTRAWINELGYSALVLDASTSASALRAGGDAASASLPPPGSEDPKYTAVMGFLYDLEDHGAVDDKWDFPPPTSDPIYPWAIGHPSVIRTSVVFWSLATQYRERESRRHDDLAVNGTLPQAYARLAPEPPPEREPIAEPGEPWRNFVWNAVDSLVLAGVDPETACEGEREVERRPGRLSARIEPGRTADLKILDVVQHAGGARIRYALLRDSRVSLTIHDLAGRLIERLDPGLQAAGDHEIVWEARARGTSRPAGVYFARLQAGPGAAASFRIALLP